MSKNIWIINQYTGGPKYGMNYRSYYLAKEFIKEKDSVTIFSGSFSHLFSNFPKTEGIFTKERIDGIDFIWVKTPKYKNSKSFGRVINMLIFMINLFFFNTKKLKKPDVIVVSSLSLFPIINGYFWSKKFKTKLIFEIRDLWPQTLIELGNFSIYHPFVLFLGWFEKFGYRKSDFVVSLLSNSKEYMIKRGMKNEKFRYIPNGISLDEVKNIQPLDKKFDILPKDKFIIGYLGTIGIANALDCLLKAAKLLKNYENIHFVIVGKGGEKERLQSYKSENKLNNITFIDPIPKIQVQSMLKKFDICYIGLKNESLFKYGVSPNKLFDYMYSAKPILYAINSGKTNIVQEANCGISVESEKEQSIANGILKLYNYDKDKLIELGKNGKNYVIQNHSYSNLAKNMKKLF